MKPEIKVFPAFTAVGYVLKPESEIDFRENGAYWLGKDFSGVSKEDYAKLSAAGRGEVGLWMHPEGTGDELYYFFGPVVESKSFAPAGMETLDIPEAEYAVFRVAKGVDVSALHENSRDDRSPFFRATCSIRSRRGEAATSPQSAPYNPQGHRRAWR